MVSGFYILFTCCLQGGLAVMYVLLLLLSRLRPVYLENSLEAVRQISTDNLNCANFVKTGLVEVDHPQGEEVEEEGKNNMRFQFERYYLLFYIFL